MRNFLTIISFVMMLPFTGTYAKNITNPGFENGWQGWIVVDPQKKALDLTDKSLSGIKAAQISSSDGYFVQAVNVEKNTNYELKAHIRGAGILGAKVENDLFVERTDKSRKWNETKLVFNSGNQNKIAIFAQINRGNKVAFDDFSLIATAGSIVATTSAISLSSHGLSPDLPPSQNFDLLDWSLSVPIDEDRNGTADTIPEINLADGFNHKKYFYTGKDGGLVMMAPVDGAPTRKGMRYTRVELREMLRRGNKRIRSKSEGQTTTKNNWVLSTAPKFVQDRAGGVDGGLTATLAINKVTTTGKKNNVGKVTIAQIGAHKKSPLRLFYRKLPHHKKGSFYVSHETLHDDQIKYYDIVGSHKDDATEPANGIALDEKFSFEIIASGHAATVVIKKENERIGDTQVYLTKGGYNSRESYLYFRLGINNRNRTAGENEFVQATYYAFDNTHVGYNF